MVEENRLGEYQILEKLAQGGMAHIYKAKTTDPTGIERLVVIKRILPHISSNQEYVQMLIDEAKIAVHFSHGNIAQIYDLGKIDDDYFIVMEYVDGITLGKILREFSGRLEKVPLDILAFCLMEVCRGLDYMHRKTVEGRPMGVVHRDISPQNIIVSYSGNVKIIDFGVAKALDKTSHTESGVLKGKFAYMSPEQADGEAIDNRSDIFAAGTLLWELLTQQRLFKRKSNLDTVRAVKKAKIEVPSKFRPDVPRELDRIVLKALKKNRAARYQVANDMAGDLEKFLLKFNPEFRPIQVTQFLYRYFGREPDEEGLTPELPELDLKKIPRSSQPLPLIEEEVTEVDYLKNFVVALTRPRLIWFLGGIFVAVVVGLTWIQLLPFTEGYHEEMSHKEVILEKKIPSFSNLQVHTIPPGAQIYLNDMLWNRTTPVNLPHLDTGKTYKIGVFLDGYRFEERQVVLTGEVAQVLSIPLIQNLAQLEILSSPLGARVIIEGQMVGVTPYTDRRVDPDNLMEVEVVMDGYKPIQRAYQLTPGEKKTVHLDLEKI